MSLLIGADDAHDDIVRPSILPFVAVHLGCLAAIWTGVTWQGLGICLALYWLRMFGITAGYHRLFSHRAFAASRAFQFIIACLAQSSLQRSVLWWSATHRHHHLHSDSDHDVHSPRHKGFIYSHVGWMFTPKHDATDLVKVADLARYPELMWLHKYEVVPGLALAGLCFLLGGWSSLVVGFLWSTVLIFHAVFCINSLAHVLGKKRYVTGDESRNNLILAFLTMGEGWHNNHRAYQSSARQGFKWWEIDLTYYILRLLSLLGIVWDLKNPPVTVLRNEQRLGSRAINRAAEQLAARFHSERIAITIASELDGPILARLRATAVEARLRLTEVLATVHAMHMPTRNEVLTEAKAMFTKTRSLDEIVDRAYKQLLVSVEMHLAARLRAVDERKCWAHAEFSYWFLKEDGRESAHTWVKAETGLPDYADLQVNRAEALSIWPVPGKGADDRTEIMLLDAARRAYSETRGTPAADHAEMFDNSPEEILKWYCVWFGQHCQLYGARRPSTKIEPVSIDDPTKDFHVTGNTLSLCERDGPAVWENLRMKVDDLAAAIKQLKGYGQ
jgi:stearoyl-CoA desaturase (delta-9 desaturase)